jgi:oxaloacetate decarboxylase gamma subunit
MGTGLLANGMMLMLVGMGTVFMFLTLLVVATGLMSRLVMKFQPEPHATTQPEEIAAITAALILHRRAQSSQQARHGS